MGLHPFEFQVSDFATYRALGEFSAVGAAHGQAGAGNPVSGRLLDCSSVPTKNMNCRLPGFCADGEDR
jgi:hypothetical protein